MPQYELMYLLGSHVADDEVPKISQQVLKFVEEAGGEDIRETPLGKKKLAYPIKKTRNGYYVVVNFSMDSQKVTSLDARIRALDSTIIRYLIVSLEEYLERLKKDKVAQSKLVRKIPVETAAAPSKAATFTPVEIKAKALEPVKEALVLEIGEEELDKKIEEALNEDLTK